MAELHARTPLRHEQAVVEKIGQLQIVENPGYSISWIARRRDGDLSGIENFIGLELPTAGRTATGDTCRAVPFAREQWLILAPWTPDFLEEVKAAGGANVSVCDQSDGWVVFEIEGTVVDSLLERLCDLDPRKLPLEGSSPSMIEHLRVIVVRLPEGLMILGARSSAGSLQHALIEAAVAIA